MTNTISITEVGPRDGLQNESQTVATEDKIAFINYLSHCGLREIEVSSFVSPKWVPQLADAVDVFAGIERVNGVLYSALVPNEKGMERALKVHAQGRLDKIAVFTAASETFSKRNTNATIAETMQRFEPVVAAARAYHLPVRAYISCAVECPYEGPIHPKQVRSVVDQLFELGLDAQRDDIDLGDTIGVAVPTDIERLYEGTNGLIEPEQTTLHLHDTYGTALACALRALQLGVRRFDSSCTGLGGCPYAPGAAGNLATEDLVYLCNRMGYETNIDLSKLLGAGRHITGVLGRSGTSRVFNAMTACETNEK